MMQKQCNDGLFQYLPDQFDRSKIQIFQEIDSTNAEAKRQVPEGVSDGTIFIANSQTAGRGRLGRSFYSPEDAGIYFSIVLRPKLQLEDMVLITVAASVEVAEAIYSVTKVYPEIKWVNDLYLGGKKVCGILTEMISGSSGSVDAVVVGIGINCSATFPDELKEIAGNIPDADDLKNCLTAELVLRLSAIEETIKDRLFLKKYRDHSMVLGREVTLVQEPGSCYLAKEIGDQGELVLEDEKGEVRRLTTGEISIRLTDPR